VVEGCVYLGAHDDALLRRSSLAKEPAPPIVVHQPQDGRTVAVGEGLAKGDQGRVKVGRDT
jgi:hypothetical protein